MTAFDCGFDRKAIVRGAIWTLSVLGAVGAVGGFLYGWFSDPDADAMTKGRHAGMDACIGALIPISVARGIFEARKSCGVSSESDSQESNEASPLTDVTIENPSA